MTFEQQLADVEKLLRQADLIISFFRSRRAWLFCIRQELLELSGLPRWKTLNETPTITTVEEEESEMQDHGHGCQCQECTEVNQTIIPNREVLPPKEVSKPPSEDKECQ